MDDHLNPDRVRQPLAQAELLEHGWRYFALHAGQRLTLFNYFIALSGLAIAASAATLQGPSRFAVLGVALGLLLCLLAVIFYKLDQRTSTLIKAAEAAIAATELSAVPLPSRLFAHEIANSGRGGSKRLRQEWTYGRSLRLGFATVGVVGLALSLLSGLRAAEIVRWEVECSSPKVGMVIQGASRPHSSSSSEISDTGPPQKL